MKSRKWSLGKAALYGVGFGIPIALLRGTLSSVKLASAAEVAGFVAGGMIIGVVLFVAIAAIRNFFVSTAE